MRPTMHVHVSASSGEPILPSSSHQLVTSHKWGHSRRNLNMKKLNEEEVKLFRMKFELSNKSIEDWYHIPFKKLDAELADIVKTEFKGSLYKALSTIFPEREWIPWKFADQAIPYGYWQDTSTHKIFFEDLGKQIGIKQLDDWYEKLSRTLVLQHRGATLLTLYNGSAIAAIKAVYPEHNWIPWKFKCSAKKMWNSPEIVSKFLSELSEKLAIKTLDDWYRVDWVQLSKFGAESLIRKHSGLYYLLKQQYPHHPWDPKKFSKWRKGQRWLVVVLKQMFPNEEIIEDYVHPKATFASSNRPMELDVFIPSKSLAFEYQGQHHYHNVGVFQPQELYHRRDEEKKALCASNNIKLVEVPYWWNRTRESLQQLIDKV